MGAEESKESQDAKIAGNMIAYRERKKWKEDPEKELREVELRIMCVGDSITVGSVRNAYRKQLIDYLTPNDNEINMVGTFQEGNMPSNNAVQAVSGATITQIQNFTLKPLKRLRPNVVLLHAGTNDIGQHLDLPNAPHRLSIIIDDVLRECPNACVIVAEIIPCAFREDELRVFNEGVRRVVRERAEDGRKVRCVDMNSGFDEDCHKDVAHPNEKGYTFMAERWFKSLKQANAEGWIGRPVDV